MKVGRAITEALQDQQRRDMWRLGFLRMPHLNVWVRVVNR